MALASLTIVQAVPLADAQHLMLVNVLLVLLIVGFSAGVALALVRRSMRQRLEAARLAAMGTATARILHQVKNPLQTILLHAEMLEDESLVSDVEARQEVCRAIVGEAMRMTELLGELSSYASGLGRRLRLDTLPLHVLVHDAARQALREGEREGIRVVVGPVEEVVVDGDPYFLRQALENVLRNAREALWEGAVSGPARVDLSLRRRSGEAVLEVRDNGPGIETDRLATVFEPFVTTKAKGMGLGLAVCREIVEGHGGRVELRSRPGAGTAVSLILPVRQAAASALQPA